jgi:hypothetical protein
MEISFFLSFCCSKGACGYQIIGLLSKSNDQNDPTKSNESKAQQIPLSSFLYQILE